MITGKDIARAWMRFQDPNYKPFLKTPEGLKNWSVDKMIRDPKMYLNGKPPIPPTR